MSLISSGGYFQARNQSKKSTIARVMLALAGKAVERKDRRRSHCASVLSQKSVA